MIIGNGISGITAARHIRKFSDNEILVVSAETDYFFSRTALMYIYMGHMKFEHTKPYEDWFWEKNRIQLKNTFIQKVNTEQKILFTDSNEKITYDQLILATGSTTHKRGWQGENLQGVQGLVSKQDLDLLEENTKNCKQAIIVGGGLIGVELAEMLHTRKIPVKMLIREEAFWRNVLPQTEAQLISNHIEQQGIELLYNTELEKIIGDENNRVQKIITKKDEEIDCDFLGITTGVKPNISFLSDSEIETDKGILVNKYLETNCKDVFAIGDCAQQRESIGNRKPIEAVWYTGRMMGETIAQTICGNKTAYNPGNWFNSAKFFDIEYQTYGWVFPEALTGHEDFYWVNKKDEKCLHFQFEIENRKFTGINTFGIRLRHEVVDFWLTENKTIDFVIDNLAKANFDKEFSKKYEQKIRLEFKLTKTQEKI